MTTCDVKYPPIEVSTPASQLPVSIEEAKAYCDYDDNDRNGQFLAWIKAATRQIEHDCEVALCTQTCKLYLPWFPPAIELAKPPVASVSSITYVDENGTTQTLSTSRYQTNLKRTPPRIVEAYNQEWPTTRTDTENCVTVTFVAGYGDADDVPELFKEAVRLKVRRMFEGCGGGEPDIVYDGLLGALRWRPIL